GRVNATVPAATDPERITLEGALALIAARKAKGASKGRAKAKPKARRGSAKAKAPAADASSGA
ncbi:MAG: hypothetical protein O7F14_04630, partial [Alphaproteobacteria bacterium]|nr:hypothetical protein [Alphaproteobacteria bacterium]